MRTVSRKCIVILIAIFILIATIFGIKRNTTKVILVKSALSFYTDNNNNKIADSAELVDFNEIDTAPKHLTTEDILKIEYLAKQRANELLLNKQIKIQEDKNKKIIILPNNKNYIKTLINEGLIPTQENHQQVQSQIKKANSLDLVVYNTFSQKYHKLNCDHIKQTPYFVIEKRNKLPKNAKPCKSCFSTNNTLADNKTIQFKQSYKTNNIEFFTTDFTKHNHPSKQCKTQMCQSLLKEINKTQNSIDFAIYGIDNQPQIIEALLNAQKRGVKIRWVYDTDENKNTIYKDTLKLKETLTNCKADIDIKDNTTNIRDSIMHNKFFIFDNKKVWTGSANISHTDLSGFNANATILIESPEIALIYKQEFEQMFDGKFHQTKTKNTSKEVLLKDSKVSINFSPQSETIDKELLPLINNAKNYIYIPVFVITHKNFNNALINAKKRGVDVKIIVDATSANSKYSSVKLLRENNIFVKTENRAGKMHMKSIIIDDEIVVLGSMNFSKSGQNYNDENTIILKNKEIAPIFKNNFLYLYNAIPNKWLHENPRAESLDSINSCYDGVDNDFDGDVDKNDNGCIKL